MMRAAIGIASRLTVAIVLGMAGASPGASRAKGLDEILPGRDVIVRPDETLVVRGNSPRRRGIVPQYNNLRTPLRANLTFSDTLLPSDRWTRWDGSPTERFDPSKQTPDNYREGHNHSQSILSEVLNATPGANAIPFWGDGVALVDGANAWGAFVSARSDCGPKSIFAEALPPGIDRGCGPEFDAQLTGLEVDVLNGGKPGSFPNKAKHGVQVVGFGNPNGQALSVICQGFDREPEHRRGQFESILYAQNSIRPDAGRMIVADFPASLMGLDFRKPLFTQGFVNARTEGIGTGMLLNEGRSGEVYGGLRWPKLEDPQHWLSLRLGDGGLRVVSHDDTRELLAIDNHGGIRLTGDVFVNGRRMSGLGRQTSPGRSGRRTLALGGLFLIATVALNVLLTRWMIRRALRPG